MATVTALRPTKRDPDRVAVHLDGRFAATLSVRSVVEMGLAVGGRCDEGGLALLTRTAAADKAVKQAMSRLNRRALSRGQLDRKLRDLGHDDAARGAALDRLASAGLLDDAAYAHALVREWKRRRLAGQRLLRQKLREKLIDAAVIDAVLAEHRDPDADADAALALARKRWAQLGRLDVAVRRRRVHGLLTRRGFAAAAIAQVLRRLDFSDPGSSAPDR